MKQILENVKAIFVFLCSIIFGVVVGAAVMVAEIILVIFIAPIAAICTVYMNGSKFTEVYVDVLDDMFTVMNKPFVAFYKEES